MIEQLTTAIEAGSAAINGWFDCACHECDSTECIQGTAAQLAEKIAALGWTVENVERGNLNCAACSNYEPPDSPFWQEADHRYQQWKEDR